MEAQQRALVRRLGEPPVVGAADQLAVEMDALVEVAEQTGHLLEVSLVAVVAAQSAALPVRIELGEFRLERPVLEA